MKARHLMAASMIVMVSLVGTAGIAAAQTTRIHRLPTAQNKQTLCAKATARLPKIQDRITKIEQRIATLKTRLAGAQAQEPRRPRPTDPAANRLGPDSARPPHDCHQRDQHPLRHLTAMRFELASSSLSPCLVW